MKEKILAALKTKYANKGFSAKTLEGIAENLAATVTEESNIQTAVDGLEGVMNVMQAEGDRRANEATAKAKADAEKAKTPPENNTETPPVDSTKDVPEWAKTLTDTLNSISKELNGLKAEKVTASRKQLLESKLQNVNPAFKATVLENFELMRFDSEDTFNTFLSNTEAKAKDFIQAETDKKLGAQGLPLHSSTQTGDKVSPLMQGYLAEKTPPTDPVKIKN
jgi:hypothetical protein